MVAEIERENEEIRNLKEQITARATGSMYFARMQLGRLLEAAPAEHADQYIREIYAELQDTAVASRANKPIGDKMIMNAAFLVEREREADFDRKGKEIGTHYGSKLRESVLEVAAHYRLFVSISHVIRHKDMEACGARALPPVRNLSRAENIGERPAGRPHTFLARNPRR